MPQPPMRRKARQKGFYENMFFMTAIPCGKANIAIKCGN